VNPPAIGVGMHIIKWKGECGVWDGLFQLCILLRNCKWIESWDVYGGVQNQANAIKMSRPWSYIHPSYAKVVIFSYIWMNCDCLTIILSCLGEQTNR
jgi:hypothetical protein